MNKNVIAATRAIVGITLLPLVAVLTGVQGFVVGPVFKNHTFIPNLIYKGMQKFLGYKVEFNKASAPVEKDKRTWYVANHMSIGDFVVLGGMVEGTFAGKADILKWPGVRQMARAVKMIGIERTKAGSPSARAKLINNFNNDFNAVMFPEGTTSDGKQVYQFNKGLITLLYGEKGVDKKGREVALEKEVVVQPIAIRIKEVNGEDATGRDDLRNLYSMYYENNTLTRLWKRLQVKNMVIELTAFAPLHPRDFPDAKDLINKAALDVASIVNPGQTTFVKKEIPVKAAAQ